MLTKTMGNAVYSITDITISWDIVITSWMTKATLFYGLQNLWRRVIPQEMQQLFTCAFYFSIQELTSVDQRKELNILWNSALMCCFPFLHYQYLIDCECHLCTMFTLDIHVLMCIFVIYRLIHLKWNLLLQSKKIVFRVKIKRKLNM